MNIEEAIQSIAEGDSLISEIAKESLNSVNGMVYFSFYILDQYEDGNGASMAIDYGFTQVSVITTYARAARILRESNLAEKDLMNSINLN
jgi:hypothetical protein